MTYTQQETSWEDGKPVEYYEFSQGGKTWRYNTSDRLLRASIDGETREFLPLSIRRDRIQQGPERNKLSLSIDVPHDAEIVKLWHPYPTSVTVGLTIYGGHIGDNDIVVTWSGRVISPKFRPDVVTLSGEPSFTLARKSGLVQCWQRGCMHVLYKPGNGLCNADQERFKLVGTVSSAAESTVKSNIFRMLPDGRLAGGYLRWVTKEGVTERRSISEHTGDTVVLLYGIKDLPIGAEVQAFPGCRHTWEDCNGFFQNGVNYGGDLYSPEKSPFDGQPVF